MRERAYKCATKAQSMLSRSGDLQSNVGHSAMRVGILSNKRKREITEKKRNDSRCALDTKTSSSGNAKIRVTRSELMMLDDHYRIKIEIAFASILYVQ